MSISLPIPPTGDPETYDALANALIVANSAQLEASERFEAGLRNIEHSLNLHKQIEEITQRSFSAESGAAGLIIEAARLIRENPQENIARALELIAEVMAANEQARSISAGSYALTRQASGEVTQGLSAWHEGTEALRVGIERATTLVQEARNYQSNGGNPDAAAA